MVLKKFDDEQATDYDVNRMYNECLSIAGLNLIRMLIDRDIDFSVGEFDWWGDAYIDSNGRENSVDYTTSTTSTFIIDDLSYTTGITDEASGDSLSDPDSFDNPTYAFNGNLSSPSDKDWTAASTTYTLGKTFGAKTVEYISYRFSLRISAVSARTLTSKIQTYNGSTWSDAETIGILTSAGETEEFSGIYKLDSSVQGVRISTTSSGATASIYVVRIYSLVYGDLTDGLIYHTISAGTFSSTISEVIGVPFVVDWETGADIKYKLTGTSGSEDTGWLDAGITPELSTFTPFTAEPDTLIVKLVPKTTSPTADTPSIKGFVVRAT